MGRRGGSVRYGTAIINAMQSEKDVFVSIHCKEVLPEQSFRIPTYRNKIEFLFSSILFLPCLLLYALYGLIVGKYSAFYSPYTHYWNWPFVSLFNLFGIKTVLTIHDGIPHTGDGNFWERIINYATIIHSRELIFLTNHVYHYLKSKINFSAKHHIIAHGPIKIKSVNLNREKPKTGLKLLFLGRVCHYKGVDLLIESLQSIPSEIVTSCTIAGEITSDQKYLKELHCPINCIWIDKWLQESEIAEEINKADLLVLPYREATQSGVMSIGISSNIPMLSTRVGGLVEQCSSKECYYVNPTPESIAEGIQEVYTDPNFHETSVQQLKKKNIEINWKNIAAQIEKTFL